MYSIIAREGIPFVAAAALCALILFALSYAVQGSWLIAFRSGAVLCILLAVFTGYFFRDPERTSPADQNLIIAPADGTVIDIREIEEPLYLKGSTVRVSIFMSLFDVHVNRSPINGEVDFVHYHPGKFISAFKDKASADNESMLIGIWDRESSRKISVKLIAGLIARRIVFYKNIHDRLRQGERISMIRFGSRVDVHCPLFTEIRVKKGDKVQAGTTVLGVFK